MRFAGRLDTTFPAPGEDYPPLGAYIPPWLAHLGYNKAGGSGLRAHEKRISFAFSQDAQE